MVSYNEYPIITSIDQVRKGSVLSDNKGIYIYLLVSDPKRRFGLIEPMPMFTANIAYIKAPGHANFKGIINHGTFYEGNRFRLISY